MKSLDKYQKIAEMLASFSSDKRLKVGAIILKDGRVISTGYNGQLPGEPHQEVLINGHDVSTVHAELNAILSSAKSGISLNQCVLVTTHHPCLNCTKAIIMAGIKTVYYINDYKNEKNFYRNKIEMVKL